MDWDDQLPGCFAGMMPPFGAPFGQHPNDKKRALAWAASLKERGLGWKDAQSQIEAYLQSGNVSAERIRQEIDRAYKLLGERLAG